MADYVKIWEEMQRRLGVTHPDDPLGLWFSETYIVMIDERRVVASVSTKLRSDIITRKYGEELKQIFADILGRKVEVTLILPSEEQYYRNPEDNQSEDPLDVSKGDGPLTAQMFMMAFNFDYTFDNFIVGTSNQFAHAACTAVARMPATDYNPLFIYSAPGLGKTHLLNAIMNELQNRDKNCRIIYVKGDDFTNQMIEAIKSGRQAAFREKYRTADVLLIDDIQFIAGKESTQEEFFHTFNTLYESHKQIIMTSDRPPKDIKTLEDRLRNRFEWGLIADIQSPDYELRIAIMRKKSHMMGIDLPEEVLSYIAENLKRNVRELEGAVKRICAKSFLSGKPVTLDLAKECLKAFVSEEEPPTVTAERIVDRVGRKYGISKEDLYGRKRTKHIAHSRAVAIYIIRKTTDMSFPTIGKMFDRDHSTIMNACQMIEDECAKNPLLDLEISDLIKEITE